MSTEKHEHYFWAYCIFRYRLLTLHSHWFHDPEYFIAGIFRWFHFEVHGLWVLENQKIPLMCFTFPACCLAEIEIQGTFSDALVDPCRIQKNHTGINPGFWSPKHSCPNSNPTALKQLNLWADDSNLSGHGAFLHATAIMCSHKWPDICISKWCS